MSIYKKDSGVPTVTHAQALDVALCWGWIDGIREFEGCAAALPGPFPVPRELRRCPAGPCRPRLA
ncbi:hypothetical protein AB3662_12240 [Sorangium cellulosum]|uniref:hypothetical protein n=1 Tax=Sorangium cellulosum TaxID=56 RepID=UPI003D9A990F